MWFTVLYERYDDDGNNDDGDDVRCKSPRINFEKGVLIPSHPSVAYMHYNYARLSPVLGSPLRTLCRFGPVSRTSYA